MVTSKTTHVRTLIIGGGLTGLATACALEANGTTDYVVLEKSARPGGLCATTFVNGYHFDYGGHFLHLHTPQGRKIVRQLLGKNLKKHTRRAFIYSNGMHVPYPFQQNLWALYPELRALVIDELTQRPPVETIPQDFETWCLQSFGYTLYEAFFRPYNEKLWGRPLREMTCDWCGPFVPAPRRKDILQSANRPPEQRSGYNAQFYYPKTGGCGSLIDALVSRVRHLQLSAPLTRLDLTRKTAWVNQQKITFEQIVNTIPLPEFINLLVGNTSLKQAARKLVSQPVTVYHLAIARQVEPFGWIYFPDAAQPFYRVGLTSYFSPDSVPEKDTSLFYIELPGLPPATPETEQQIWNGLHQKGLVTADDVKLFSHWQPIGHAYVVFNKQRAELVPQLLNKLEEDDCYCVGRYGRWEYSFMERSLLQAVELAQKLV